LRIEVLPVMQLPCPYCGLRNEAEFQWGGESHVVRPAETASDADWTDYLFARRNPRGRALERWVHIGGCGAWFNVSRDTVTHHVQHVYPIGAPDPAAREPHPDD